MKKSFLLSLGLALLAFSCTTIESDPSYVMLDGKQFNVSIGKIDDDGTNSNDLTYRIYDLEFSNKTEYPSTVFSLTIYSTATTAPLRVGTYNYSLLGNEAGTFSYFVLGVNREYDDTNTLVSGTTIDDYNHSVDQGQITISRDDDDRYVFDFEITVKDDNDNTKVLEGHINLVLEEYNYL